MNFLINEIYAAGENYYYGNSDSSSFKTILIVSGCIVAFIGLIFLLNKAFENDFFAKLKDKFNKNKKD